MREAREDSVEGGEWRRGDERGLARVFTAPRARIWKGDLDEKVSMLKFGHCTLLDPYVMDLFNQVGSGKKITISDSCGEK